MKKCELHPVVLCGGSGSRLWPLSRASYPKQLLNLVDENQSLLQSTLLRASKLPDAKNPILICHSEHRFLVGDQCNAMQPQTNQLPAAIYLEPVSRNTAPAIALAALHLAENPTQPNPDAVMLVLPADHIIQNQDAFSKAVDQAVIAAQKGWLVTFGIKPNAAETGYGYIRAFKKDISKNSSLPSTVYAVDHFVEKPDFITAERYLAEGSYFWNSGMFVFTAQAYLDELAQYRPDILNAVRKSWQKSEIDLDFIRPDRQAFSHCPSESIDYALMQTTKNAAVVEVGSIGWSDIGSWDSLWKALPKDEQGNSIRGDVFAEQSNNNLIFSTSRQVTTIGLQDMVVVETTDAVLVISKSHAQSVKLAIEHLINSGRNEHIDHHRVHRPWGWYESTDRGDRFQVKRLMVRPGQKLSLQMHHHRAEHWVVVSGTAKVTIGEQNFLIAENQSTYIPIGITHRLENPGKVPLHLIEVQSGSYLGEDDIVRFEDTYGRTH